MRSFWDEVIASRLGGRAPNQAWDDLSREASFRPTLYIGLGGFGCMVIRSLKEKIEDVIPNERVREGFAFIGLDTHHYERNDILTSSEYIPLSMGILPDEVAGDPNYSRYLEWYRDLVGKWAARTIQNGANKVRAVGRLAFLFPSTLSLFFSGLNSALNRIMTFRANFGIDVPPKVYLISSLAGGTGSGAFFDVLFITTQHLRNQYGADYRLQVILSTPEALEGEAKEMDLLDFYANTYATLKEMFHFILGGEETVSYGITGFERLRVTGGAIPQTIYLITDRNSTNKIIVERFDELGELVTSYLLSEILTPMSIKQLGGQPAFQEGENWNSDQPGHGGMPRALSSFGVVRFGLPYEEVEELLTLSLVHRAISDELTGSYKLDAAISWVRNNNLAEAGSNQLQESIRRDKEGHEIKISLDVEGNLSGVKRTELGKACKELKRRFESSLENQYLPLLKGNANREEARGKLQKEFKKIMEEESLGSALRFLTDLHETLKAHRKALSEELNESEGKLQKASSKVDQSIKAVVAAAQSGFFGRKGRIRTAVGALDTDMEAYLNQQIIVWSQKQGVEVYDDLISLCEDMQKRWNKVKEALESRRSFVENRSRDIALKIDRMADINVRGPGNRFSLLNSDKVRDIYDEYIGEDGERNITFQARSEWKQSGLISDTASSVKEWLGKAQERIKSEVRSRIEGLNLLQVIEKFYPDKERDDLFISIIALGSPLFPLDPNKKEPQYSDEYVVAVNPEIRDGFLKMLSGYLPPGTGVGYAYFGSKYEVIIYSISRGYTAHSLTRLNTYKAYYDLLQEKYKRALIEGRPYRPIHAWVGAEDWEEPMPKAEEEEAYKWFIVGRAFSYLLPTATTEDGKPDERKNRAFIYTRGNNYYISADDGSPLRIGNGLENAVMNFESHPEWQDRIKKLAEAKIEEEGRATIRRRLEEEYMPIIESEIESSERGRDYDRVKLLRELRKALRKFIEEELRERKV